MSVRVETNGPVTTVILHRPEDGTFRAGADLKAVSEGRLPHLAVEFEGGLQVLETESLAGATRFARGAGRHGSFE